MVLILIVYSHSRWRSGFVVISSRQQNLSSSSSRCFASGGFGTSSSSPKKTKSARKLGGDGILDEMMLMTSNDTKERLDRFGLPRHPTEESVFPPLSSDIVRVPAIVDDV